MAGNQNQKAKDEDAAVKKVFPPFRNWRQVYAFVLFWLLFLMGLFEAFTLYFSP